MELHTLLISSAAGVSEFKDVLGNVVSVVG